MKHRSTPLTGPARAQQGAILIISLIMLVVMTLLGLTAMNTTSTEEKMAANSQERNRSFHAAETGLSEAFDNDAAFNLDHTYSPASPVNVANSGTLFDYTTEFTSWSAPPQGSLYSATSFRAAHFDIESEGSGAGGSTTLLHGGAYQIAPKAK